MSDITIKSIDTEPEYDSYTGGVSHTVLALYPDERMVIVSQEYRTGSTPYNEWLGQVLTMAIPAHPEQSVMDEWINENADLLNQVCDGHTVEWDGNNHRGYMNESALIAWESLYNAAEYIPPFWEVYDVREWVQDWIGTNAQLLHANMSDEEIAGCVDGMQPIEPFYVIGRNSIEDELRRYLADKYDDESEDEE